MRISYFSGAISLDRVLYSLLALKDKCRTCELSNGTYQLVNTQNIERKIKERSSSLFKSYKLLRKSPNFEILKFCEVNEIEQDVVGLCPLRFKNPRVIWHVLKMSYAIVLTLKMHRLQSVRVPQRKTTQEWVVTDKNLFTNVFRYILGQVLKKKITDNREKDLISLLKVSLCRMTSIAWEQSELPEGDFIELIPKVYWDRYFKILQKSEVSRLCFSLLQSKALCEEVPESFIQDSLIKHRKQLSQQHNPLSSETLDFLREQGREFGKKMKNYNYYDPEKGSNPSNRATFGFQRNKGGVKGDLVFHDILKNDKFAVCDPEDRSEPFVILLCGHPGSGKSTQLNQIISNLEPLFPGTKSTDMVYQRTCSVDHWDGYNHQPITILDDIGQGVDGKDILEFITLVSTCPYVLPMAELSEKGRKFSSSVIICTTNLPFGESLATNYGKRVLCDEDSFWRRFHFVSLVEDRKYYRLSDDSRFSWNNRNLLHVRPDLVQTKKLNCPYGVSDTKDLKGNPSRLSLDERRKLWTKFDIENWDFKPQILERWKIHNNYAQKWRQTILNGINDTCDDFYNWLYSQDLPEELSSTGLLPDRDTSVHGYLSFPARPPNYPLPVRVEPIVEPLKVRTITAGIGSTFCLKPFQVAMWKTLNHYPQFALTHGTCFLESSIERIFDKSEKDDVWISGDYTAATDSIPLEASLALMEGILESVDHQPTKRWVLKELSPHLLVYPPKYGLEPVLQESGQLMGSLLSFPLLCLLNDCTAKLAGLSRDKYLINGDDILMRGPPETYEKWKNIVSQVGFKLSIGKNYIHPTYGSINSQMIMNGTVVESGKQRILDRKERILGECLKDFQLAMFEHTTEEVNNLFKSVNRTKLNNTIRNIGIPYSHGGLGFSWDQKHLNKTLDKSRAKLVYFHDMLKRLKPQDHCISVPYYAKQDISKTELRIAQQQLLEPVSLKEYHEEFLNPSILPKTMKRISGNQSLRELFHLRELEELPPLPFIHCFQFRVHSTKDIGLIQAKIDSLFFNGMTTGCPFTYQDFREHVLKSLCGIDDKTKEEVRVGFSLYDFPAELEFLGLDLNYNSKPFSKEDFVKELGVPLIPKDNEVNYEEMVSPNFLETMEKDENQVMEIYNHSFNTRLVIEEKDDFDFQGSYKEFLRSHPFSEEENTLQLANLRTDQIKPTPVSEEYQ